MSEPHRLASLLAQYRNQMGEAPDISETWDEAADLLLMDHSSATVECVIHYSQGDEFWRSKVRSMPYLKSKFSTLKEQAEAKGLLGKEPGLRSSLEERVARRAKNYMLAVEQESPMFTEVEAYEMARRVEAEGLR